MINLINKEGDNRRHLNTSAARLFSYSTKCDDPNRDRCSTNLRNDSMHLLQCESENERVVKTDRMPECFYAARPRNIKADGNALCEAFISIFAPCPAHEYRRVIVLMQRPTAYRRPPSARQKLHFEDTQDVAFRYRQESSLCKRVRLQQVRSVDRIRPTQTLGKSGSQLNWLL